MHFPHLAGAVHPAGVAAVVGAAPIDPMAHDRQMWYVRQQLLCRSALSLSLLAALCSLFLMHAYAYQCLSRGWDLVDAWFYLVLCFHLDLLRVVLVSVPIPSAPYELF